MKNRYFTQYFRDKRPYFNNAFVAEVYRCATDLHSPVVKFVRDTILASARRAGLPDSVNSQHFLHCESPIAQTLVTLEWFDTPLYDISPALLEALAHSDTGDMRLCDLRSPNHVYYLHWGPQDDLLLYGQIPVEGAVVAIVEHKWQLALVGRTGESWPSTSNVRDSFMLKFPENAHEVTFARAVELADPTGVGLTGVNTSRRPHWRRGHWRHQACGPQLSQRKLIWMRPTRVLAGPIMSCA